MNYKQKGFSFIEYLVSFALFSILLLLVEESLQISITQVNQLYQKQQCLFVIDAISQPGFEDSHFANTWLNQIKNNIYCKIDMASKHALHIHFQNSPAVDWNISS